MNLSTIVLRFGLVILFLWFGLSQVINPSAWVAWIPEWAPRISGLSDSTIVLINGWFETVGGVLLLLGLWTRIVALILSFHLFSIAWAVGYNDIGVRDFVLAIAAFSIFLSYPDALTLDARRAQQSAKQSI